MEVLFCTSTHIMGSATERAGHVNPQPITIGDGGVIGAGAVVNKDCAPNGMYAGVPARRVKELPVED
jgi:maltose O-acetyltransferase